MKKLLFLFSLFILCCKPGDIPFTMSEWDKEVRDNLNRIGIADEYTQFKYEYTTPGGIKVKSVVPVPSEVLPFIDQGRQEQIERFRVIFPNFREPSPGTVLFIHPNVRYDGDGVPSAPCVNHVNEPDSPCIFVAGNQAAGTVLGTDDRWQKISADTPIVLPHQQAQNWRFTEYLKATIRNENEHREAWGPPGTDAQGRYVTGTNRSVEPTGVFYYFQGPNDQHPFQWGDQPLGLKSQAPAGCLPKSK